MGIEESTKHRSEEATKHATATQPVVHSAVRLERADELAKTGAAQQEKGKSNAHGEKQAEKFEAKLEGRGASTRSKLASPSTTREKRSLASQTHSGVPDNVPPQSADDARAIAKAIKGNAEQLDEVSIEANQSLNRAFKAAYEAADAA